MTSSIPSMEFASSSSKLPGMYDVLINFSGEDIQRKFVSHLDSALSAVGFTVFLHHENAVKSTHPQEPILNLCRVVIVVFTRSYSESAWCLHQLQQIIQWHQTYSRHVLPVYYEIDPSEVRLQKGYFGKAFKETARQTFSGEQVEDGMSRWSNALIKAANFYGWDERIYRSDAELVDKIVKSVLKHQVLRWLEVLNLSPSMNLTETPDFSRLPRLEHLILKDCRRLRKVHHSIGFLYYLTLLNLKDCTSVSNLPIEVYKLKSLKTLILSGCSMIDLLEKDIVQMESLKTIIAENTAVKEVPFSIVSSKNIGYISLRGFERLPRNLFHSIIRSGMSLTTNPISCYHPCCLDMGDNSWNDITPLLSSLANLRSVLVQCDTEFQLSKQVISILVECFATITESGISKQHFRSSFVGVGAYHEFFNVSDEIYEVSESSELCDVSLREDNDPYWLAYKGDGHSVSFTVPPDRHIKGLALCVVYLSTLEIIEPEFTSVLIVNYTKCTLHIHKPGTIIFFNDEDWDGIKSNLGSGDNMDIFVNFGHGLVVKNTVVYLICSESNDF